MRLSLADRRMPRERYEAAWRAHRQVLSEYWRDHGRNRQWLIDPLEQWIFDLWWKPRIDASLLALSVSHLALRAWQERERGRVETVAPAFPTPRERYPTRQVEALTMLDVLRYNA